MREESKVGREEGYATNRKEGRETESSERSRKTQRG